MRKHLALWQLAVNTVVMAHGVPPRLRSALLRWLGVNLGPSTYLASRSILKDMNVTTGSGCFINHRCHVDGGPLLLGDRVFVGMGVTFVTRDHKMGPSSQRAGANIDNAISVGDGAWIGANATILGGVNIAAGCVVAAGAVVTKSTEPNGLYGGVPARRIRDLS